MKIAVEGCAHGELEKIYNTIEGIEKNENIKIDLLLCCGDFQSTRNLDDLQTMAVPKKYLDICTFYKYYSGELVAPILTIFIGGNHEASNYLQELPYGGWVAPNIYYLGYAGVVQVNGIRIGGISGIYKGHDFLRGRYEYSPYTEESRKSVYHVRQLEVFRLKQLSGALDIFLSHDWPRGIYNYGNKAQLLTFKPHFREDIETNQLGSRPCEDLLYKLQPLYWFAAHMHCKFTAMIPHNDEKNGKVLEKACSSDSQSPEDEKFTKFLALDKCLPRRRFLQIIDIDTKVASDDNKLRFEYDSEWLAILHLTNHLINVKKSNYYLPNAQNNVAQERVNYTPNDDELNVVLKKFNEDLCIPENFYRTVRPYSPNDSTNMGPRQPKAAINPQSKEFCDKLGLDDPLVLAMLIGGHNLNYANVLGSDDIEVNASSSSQSSFVCTETPVETTLKRKSNFSLTLPKPISKESDSDCIPLKDVSQLSIKNPDEIELTENSDHGHSENEFDKMSIEEPTISLPDVTLVDPRPPSKKLKRRNQDIYKENDSMED